MQSLVCFLRSPFRACPSLSCFYFATEALNQNWAWKKLYVFGDQLGTQRILMRRFVVNVVLNYHTIVQLRVRWRFPRITFKINKSIYCFETVYYLFYIIEINILKILILILLQNMPLGNVHAETKYTASLWYIDYGEVKWAECT